MGAIRTGLGSVVASLLLASCLTADAQSGSLVPEGFEAANGVGRIAVWVNKERPPSYKTKTELTNRLTAVRDTLYKTYDLGADCKRLGFDTGLFKDRSKDSIDFIVFPDQESMHAWERSLGSAPTRPHFADYSTTVSLALMDDSIPDEEWVRACTDLAHVYVDLTVYTPLPPWLDEGFATHIAFTNRHVSPMGLPSFLDRLERVGQRRDSEEFGALADLLEERSLTEGAPSDDQSWILVDMLARRGLFKCTIAQLQQLDCAAVGRPNGVAEDVRGVAARYVLQALGGPAKLQDAWAAHMNRLLSNPENPKSPGGALPLAGTPTAMCSLDAALLGKQQGAREIGHVEVSRHLTGKVRYDGPGPADLQTGLRVGDGKGRWSRGYLVQAWARSAPDGSIPLTEYDIPVLGDDRVAEFTIDIKVDGGGSYHVLKMLNFRR